MRIASGVAVCEQSPGWMDGAAPERTEVAFALPFEQPPTVVLGLVEVAGSDRFHVKVMAESISRTGFAIAVSWDMGHHKVGVSWLPYAG